MEDREKKIEGLIYNMKEKRLLEIIHELSDILENEIECMYFLHKFFQHFKLTPIQAMGILELIKQDIASDLRDYEKKTEGRR